MPDQVIILVWILLPQRSSSEAATRGRTLVLTWCDGSIMLRYILKILVKLPQIGHSSEVVGKTSEVQFLNVFRLSHSKSVFTLALENSRLVGIKFEIHN
ncbi:hypothetical protein DFJ43DRAFT_1087125 [Lentinula guzmanii]|uniref:Secreted protein n=1 Tax=Lentinula guzmanii TaxID=2804957 RepID=A0AA38MXY6_9AGAR|nr:hypothetical protein DFJ43DRAFT_1087125 [Lentinula guzmanii]